MDSYGRMETTFLKTVDSLTNTNKRASKIIDSIKNTDSWEEERKKNFAIFLLNFAKSDCKTKRSP